MPVTKITIHAAEEVTHINEAPTNIKRWPAAALGICMGLSCLGWYGFSNSSLLGSVQLEKTDTNNTLTIVDTNALPDTFEYTNPKTFAIENQTTTSVQGNYGSACSVDDCNFTIAAHSVLPIALNATEKVHTIYIGTPAHRILLLPKK